jgi:gamma-glutamyltranspeptidase/glutathione hydrolase
MRWKDQMSCINNWYTPEEMKDGKVELSVDGKGTAPICGQLFRNPHMANVLRSLGTHGAQHGFYNAFPGKSIVETIQRHGGVMTMEDLTNHTSSFPNPISVNYHGINLWEIPPNGQGIAGLIALEGLNSLEENDMLGESQSLEDETCHPQSSTSMLHAQIEMMRMGFGDARSFVCDPDFVSEENRNAMKSSTEWLLDKDRIAIRALKLFDKNKASVHGIPDPSSCTVSFQVVDKDGNAMSFVNR